MIAMLKPQTRMFRINQILHEMYKYQLSQDQKKSKNKKVRNEWIKQLLLDGIFVKKYLYHGAFIYCSVMIDFTSGTLIYDGKNQGDDETNARSTNYGEIDLKYLCKIQKGAKTAIFWNSNIEDDVVE
eukprot:272526_1